MKKSFLLGIKKSLFAAIFAGSLIPFLVGCENLLGENLFGKDENKDSESTELTGNANVDKLLTTLKTGKYTGKPSGVKLSKGASGKLIVAWTNPTDDKFTTVNIYLDDEKIPVFQWRGGAFRRWLVQGGD